MARDRHNDLDNPTDQEWIKMQLKAIKRAKKRGDEPEAQRRANELFDFLGWER
jgi:hypothetical protein